MRIILGIILILAGLAIGVYLGVWVMFVGGIKQVADAVQHKPKVDGGQLGWGIVRIVFASTVGGIVGFFVGAAGVKLLLDD